MPKSAPVKILHIEDVEADALVVEWTLRKQWPDVTMVRVDTEEDTREALRRDDWHAIVCDQNMPGFSAARALEIVTEFGLDVPFIVVSGAMTMEDAVSLLKAGAHDFVRKDDLARLAPALERELGEAGRRRRAEAALRIEHKNQEMILNAMDMGAYIVDDAHTVRYVNSAIKRMFGPLENSRCHEYLFGLEKMCSWCKEGGGAGENKSRHEIRNPVNGRLYDVTCMPIPNLDGSVSKLTFVRDITDAKREQDRLRQADKMDSLGNLAGGIAHDLKNMLFPIMNLTALTLKSLPEGSIERIRLEKVVEATKRAHSLTEKIHAFSHADDSTPKLCNVRALVKNSLDIATHSLPASASLECHLGAGEGKIRVDSAQFQTMILNLVSNAVDALEGMVGVVSIALSEVRLDEPPEAVVPLPCLGDYARLAVTDTGTGMDEATAQRIFEPYFTTKERGKGTGLGMAMVQKFVVGHDGGITLVSVPGEGTTFTVYLPLAT